MEMVNEKNSGNIILTTDFSESADSACSYAADEARKLKVGVDIVNVFDGPMLNVATYEYVPPMPLDEVLRQEILGSLKAQLENIKSKYFSDVSVQTHILDRKGTVGETVAQYAVTSSAPLIVTSTHGQGFLTRSLLGSIAEQILHYAPCPVLMVPPSTQAVPTVTTYQNIVVPVDFSPSSKEALRAAVIKAQQQDAMLMILHIIDESYFTKLFHSRTAEAVVSIQKSSTSYKDELDRRIKELAQETGYAKAKGVVLTKEYSIPHTIAKFVESMPCPLIVIGTDRTVSKISLIGRVAERLSHQISCPMLLIPKK